MKTTYTINKNGNTIQLKYDEKRGVHVIFVNNWYSIIVRKKAKLAEEMEYLTIAVTHNKIPKKAA